MASVLTGALTSLPVRWRSGAGHGQHLAGAEPLLSVPLDPLERRGSQQPSAESRDAGPPRQAAASGRGVTTRGRATRRTYTESEFESGGAMAEGEEDDEEAASEDRRSYQEVARAGGRQLRSRGSSLTSAGAGGGGGGGGGGGASGAGDEDFLDDDDFDEEFDDEGRGGKVGHTAAECLGKTPLSACGTHNLRLVL